MGSAPALSDPGRMGRPALRRRSALAGAAFGALLVVGCSLEPSADRAPAREHQNATAVGTVVDASGAPLIGQRVQVNGAVPVGGLGFGCGEPCGPNDAADTTDATGTYALSLRSAYVPGTETNTDWFVVVFGPRGAGVAEPARSSLEFEVNIRRQDVPPLPLWTVDPVVTVDGWQVKIDATGARPVGVADVGLLLIGDDGRSTGGLGTTATIDARLLESPVHGGTALQARAWGNADVTVPHANGRTIYHQRTSSATHRVPLAPVPDSVAPPARPAAPTVPLSRSATTADPVRSLMATWCNPSRAGCDAGPNRLTGRRLPPRRP